MLKIFEFKDIHSKFMLLSRLLLLTSVDYILSNREAGSLWCLMPNIFVQHSEHMALVTLKRILDEVTYEKSTVLLLHISSSQGMRASHFPSL